MRHIVLIEDNSSDRWIIKMAIEQEGIAATFHELVDGEQAMQFAAQACEAPPEPAIDLILLDLNLPRYSGEEVLTKFRACLAETPILVVSSADPVREQPRLASYTPHYFQKPYGLDEFLKIGKAVAALVDGKATA
jgi:DNA-binding response OmpR family regulator